MPVTIDPDAGQGGSTVPTLCTNYVVVGGEFRWDWRLMPVPANQRYTNRRWHIHVYDPAGTVASGPRAGQTATRNSRSRSTTCYPTGHQWPTQVDPIARMKEALSCLRRGTDPDDDALIFDRDFNADGIYETTGPTPMFSAAGLDGPANQTVNLRVCDAQGACVTAAANVAINNVAPAVEEIVTAIDPVAVGNAVAAAAAFETPECSTCTVWSGIG